MLNIIKFIKFDNKRDKSKNVFVKIFWSTSTYACKIDKHLKNIIGYAVVTCNEVIDAVANLYNKPTNLKKIGH